MSCMLIIGATSAIAQATAREWLSRTPQNPKLILVARNHSRLEQVANDMSARGCDVDRVCVDLSAPDAAQRIISACQGTSGGVDICLYAAGTLSDQQLCLEDPLAARREIEDNYLIPVHILVSLLPFFRAQQRGQLVVISSVAGDRGRQSNVVYGSAKAGLSAFADGLRGYLRSSGVKVLVVKPGPTNTPMTANRGIQGPLMVAPEVIGRNIVSAMQANKRSLYTPWFWCWIMTILKHIPQVIFDRLKI